MSKFKIGDRIRNIDTGWVGTVIGVSYGKPWSTLVAYDENDEIKGDNEYYVREEDIEFVDKKQAFLERLQKLLATFDAVVAVSWNDGWQEEDAEYPLIDLDVLFKDGTSITYDNILGGGITSENVFDHDKD